MPFYNTNQQKKFHNKDAWLLRSLVHKLYYLLEGSATLQCDAQLLATFALSKLKCVSLSTMYHTTPLSPLHASGYSNIKYSAYTEIRAPASTNLTPMVSNYMFKDNRLLGCSAMQAGMILPAFQRSLLPPSSRRPPGCRDLWNAGKLIPVYMALQPRRQPSSYSLPWEPQTLLNCVSYLLQQLVTLHLLFVGFVWFSL
jgi:hypothetical protein